MNFDVLKNAVVSRGLVMLMLFAVFASIAFAADAVSDACTDYATGNKMVLYLCETQETLKAAGTLLAGVFILVGGVLFALSEMGPAEQKGKYKSWAIGCLVAGIVCIAIVGGLDFLVKKSSAVVSGDELPNLPG
ncbi:MAG: hypothetical protein ABIH99_05610 [Candidatus Micrarchaeota archaeon]